MARRQTAFYRVLYRPSFLLGGEREPVLITLVVAVGLGMSGLNLLSLAVALLLWFGGIAAFRRMAKADPYMSRVYARQLVFRPFYSSRSRPNRTE
jgi:type IV secretory pathway TrbD component